MKKILTIQDISCVGQCSLTVAMPIISAFGIETAILPTALLSTHTGGFKGFTFLDLTNELPKIINHWKNEGITFDGIYTGYLGSIEEVETVIKLVDDFKKDNILVVDPAMADNGKLYSIFNDDYVDAMRNLCSKADYIVPNITEACYLLGIPYFETYDEEFMKKVLKALAKTGPNHVMITGVSFEEGKLGMMMYDKLKDEYTYYVNEKIPVSFHGTGDIYASCFFGALVKGYSDYEAAKIAVDFTLDAIKNTIDDKDEHWYGVHFEPSLKMLTK